MPDRRQVEPILAPQLRVVELLVTPHVDHDRAVAERDVLHGPVEDLHSGQDHPPPGQPAGHVGPSEDHHIGAGGAEVADHALEAGHHRCRVEVAAEHVVATTGEAHQVRLERQGDRHLLADDGVEQAAPDREIGVSEFFTGHLSGQSRRDQIGPTPEGAVASQIVHPLGEAVPHRHVAAPTHPASLTPSPRADESLPPPARSPGAGVAGVNTRSVTGAAGYAARVLMRMSTLFLRTLREDPAEAEVPSHKLLVRAGYVRRAAPGGYTWLPLGKRVLDKIAAIVHEEMAAIGAQEVHFPALLPREAYEASGRWAAYGNDIFRLKDRRGADYLLGPTHEELFTLLVKDLYSSYKDFPVILYQVQTKYRDEARPRAGLLRGREFLMKDAYSFDLTDEGLVESYTKHRDAYIKIFDRLGLEYTIVTAMSGAMGGSGSEEFLAPAAAGEDTYVGCTNCDYAANPEAVGTPPPPGDVDAWPAMTAHDTPGTPTIESLVDFANAEKLGGRADWTAADTLKNVVLKLTPPGGETQLLVVGVPGDREVDLKRVEAAV